jgi:quercetin dioxygenase-like cupin family protein
MWNRGYIPRLSGDDLPWVATEAVAPALAPGTTLRVLSRDLQQGASTCLWRIPRGWHHAEPFALDEGTSLFVLEGALRRGTVTCTRGCFSYLPGGWVHEAMSSETGALVLAMWDGPLVPRKAPTPDEAANARAARSASPAGRMRDEPVAKLDTHAMSGVRTFIEGPAIGITVKLLRTDPVTNGMTLLVDIAAGWSEARARHHDCVEESYKLAGSLRMLEDGQAQELGPGDYFFRPPYIKHGPMLTEAGTTSLIRFSGSVVNHYGPVVRD